MSGEGFKLWKEGAEVKWLLTPHSGGGTRGPWFPSVDCQMLCDRVGHSARQTNCPSELMVENLQAAVSRDFQMEVTRAVIRPIHGLGAESL